MAWTARMVRELTWSLRTAEMSRPAKVVGARGEGAGDFHVGLAGPRPVGGEAARPSPAGRGAPPAGLLCRARVAAARFRRALSVSALPKLENARADNRVMPETRSNAPPKATARYITGTKLRQIGPVNVVVGTLLSLFEQPGARHRVGTGRKPRGQPSRVVQDGLELGAPMPSRSITAAPDEGGRSGAPPPPLSRSITAAAG
jgi:hypothetical protein